MLHIPVLEAVGLAPVGRPAGQRASLVVRLLEGADDAGVGIGVVAEKGLQYNTSMKKPSIYIYIYAR
jgi:hypothetical protein